ncbi:MAG: carbohydrate-binding family 9-like protein [Planctomycetota bacterium]|nr:carbohydrate-binding family 9-like protein [Planctomycetota bacterium]
MRRTCQLAAVLSVGTVAVWALQAQEAPRPLIRVPRVEDFEITGDGSRPAWKRSDWVDLRRRDGEHPYDARFKVLYSRSGLYFLMEGSDRKVTATMSKDFMNLWTEDVYEVFLWTDERHPVYFEYEISPLGKELPLIIPNFDGTFYGWIPWHYEGARRVKKKTSAVAGELRSGASIQGWRAEFFVPYDLLKPLQNVPPRSGSRWRANFYRVDHDGGKKTSWDWARVGPSFHEYRKFGTLVFE